MIRLLLGKLQSVDSHTAEIIDGSVRGLIVRAGTVALVFLFNVALTRTLGAEQAGAYYLGVAIISMLAVFSLMGLDNGSIRHAANLVAEQRWNDLGTLFLRLATLVFLSSAVVAALVFALSPVLAERFFSVPDFAEPLRRFAIALPLLALLWLSSRFLQSAGRAPASLFFQSAAVPIVMLCLLVLPLGWNILSVSTAYVLASVVGVFLSIAWWRRSVPMRGMRNAQLDMRPIWKSGRMLLPANIVNKVIVPWAAVLFLGVWGSATDVAWYSTAIRVAALISFAVLPVNTILAPKTAVLARRKEYRTMYHVALRATGIIVLIAIPVVLPIVFFPSQIMSIFGPEFGGAAVLLGVLALGQVVNVLTGPVQSLLVMTGNEHLHRRASYLGGAATLILCLVLIPRFGALGAAWTSVGAIATANLASAAMVWQLWRRTE